ncbi:caveolin-2-like [Mercenaria mercenaria]|uniref:caveolin-2-like n=1 Tax=Mercenaria mercenaria TaxID=6596 RepID=UPI001E1D4DAC|nr:caveolin-2-like [Mercenaria mercenaria]
MADEYFAQQDRERERVSKPRQTRVAPAEQQPKENRDPNNLNSHIECQYYSVFAEPQTSPQSVDCIWEFSEIVFDCFKECWYKMFGLCCGICIAIAWGIEFVPVIFSHVWCFTPFIQLLNIILTGWCRPVWFLCVNLCISPCTQSCAYFFHNCGYGKMTRPPTPKIFPDRPKRKAAPKPIENKIEPKKEEKVLAPVPVVVAAKGEFDEYDKEKIAKSVKRQMMLF